MLELVLPTTAVATIFTTADWLVFVNVAEYVEVLDFNVFETDPATSVDPS